MSAKDTIRRVLRLSQTRLDKDCHRIEIALEFEGRRCISTSEFSFRLPTQEQEDIRWYLEDYLQYPIEPGPKIAARVERNMAQVGKDLFEKIFHYNDDTRTLWGKARDHLNETRVEIVTEVQEATIIPWELMRDPTTDVPVALDTCAFVRASHQPIRTPKIARDAAGPIRILVVICRPKKGEDVPFRSVANRVVGALNSASRNAFAIEVLRPSSFESLAEKLRSAKMIGKSYDIVHFDGHGAFLDVDDLFEQWRNKSREELEVLLSKLVPIDPHRFSPETIYPNPRRKGRRGYLVFDNPTTKYNLRLVDGQELGRLLWETDVPILVINACRSAHAEALEQPEIIPEDIRADVHAQVRAYGSLAQEVMDAGLTGVVAMRYNVYVSTAAEFVSHLYRALAHGDNLGQAVTRGCKQLHNQPVRVVAHKPRPLQDWCVPVVYEAFPISLFPKPQEDEVLQLEPSRKEGSVIVCDSLQSKVPVPPSIGFFGRDEILLDIDRTFDTQHIVLIYGYAGSGKTTLAAEFTRWYKLTGGAQVRLFTSFEQYQPLSHVINQLEPIYERFKDPNQPPWSICDKDKRYNFAIEILSKLSIIWIWDNVESITGFPAGSESAWSSNEQIELANFLLAAGETKSKFILTSRRDEHIWLHDLPAPVNLPPMPMLECMQIAQALVKKYNHQYTDICHWRPLLRFAQGNPLTVTVLVRQVLRTNMKTPNEIQAFVEKLRAREVEFEDDEDLGRAKSLGASLRYGFESCAFKETDYKILALLYLFQGSVNVSVLRIMGDLKADWTLPEVEDLTEETATTLLDRAAEVGLLTAYGNGYYSIHPALPWFFKNLFDAHYIGSKKEMATRAFVEATSVVAQIHFETWEAGTREAIPTLAFEEANYLAARRLARTNGWWDALGGTMLGLKVLYEQTGRWAEWKCLVEEVVADLVDPNTDGPIPGRENFWLSITQNRVLIAEREHRYKDAERLQRLSVKVAKEEAASVLCLPRDSLNQEQRDTIRRLAVTLENLGGIEVGQGRTDCVELLEKALELGEYIGDNTFASGCAFNLGTAYKNVNSLYDIDQAKKWYQRALELTNKNDLLRRGQGLNQLGACALARCLDAQFDNRPKKEQIDCWAKAMQYYSDALRLLPTYAIADLSVTHNQLGILYSARGQVEVALQHFNKSLQYKESIGDLFRAGTTRRQVALTLMQAGRLEDARLYALAALRDFEPYGKNALEQVHSTKSVIREIEGKLDSSRCVEQ